MKIRKVLTEIQVTYKHDIPMSQLPKVSCSADAYMWLSSIWSENRSYIEEFNLLLLNRANAILGYHRLSIGGTTSCLVDVKKVAQLALKSNCSGVILSHNHPSGNLKPSEADKTITAKIKRALEILEIQLLDHLILDDAEGYLSMADDGIL